LFPKPLPPISSKDWREKAEEEAFGSLVIPHTIGCSLAADANNAHGTTKLPLISLWAALEISGRYVSKKVRISHSIRKLRAFHGKPGS
jgi:hypothetical protein